MKLTCIPKETHKFAETCKFVQTSKPVNTNIPVETHSYANVFSKLNNSVVSTSCLIMEPLHFIIYFTMVDAIYLKDEEIVEHSLCQTVMYLTKYVKTTTFKHKACKY